VEREKKIEMRERKERIEQRALRARNK